MHRDALIRCFLVLALALGFGFARPAIAAPQAVPLAAMQDGHRHAPTAPQHRTGALPGCAAALCCVAMALPTPVPVAAPTSLPVLHLSAVPPPAWRGQHIAPPTPPPRA